MPKNLFSFLSNEMSDGTKAVLENAKQLFKEYSFPTLVLDGGKKIIFANNRALDFLFYGEEEIAGISAAKLGLKKSDLKPGAVLKQKITDKFGQKINAVAHVSSAAPTELLIITFENAPAASAVAGENALDMLNCAPFGVCLRDKEGGVLFWNSAAETLTGFSFKETEGRELGAVLGGGTLAAEIARADKEVLQSGGPSLIKNLKINAGAGEKIINIYKCRKKISDDETLFLDIFEDVTVSCKESLKNAQTQKFFETVINNIPLSLYARDRHGRYLVNNKKSIEFFSGGAVTHLQENLDSLYEARADKEAWRKNNPEHETEEQVKKYLSREEEVFKTGKIIDVPYEEYVLGDGSKTLLHLIKAPVPDENGNIIAVLTIAEDIGGRLQQEREILDAKNFLQKVVDNLPVALLAKKSTGEYILWNKKSEELFGAGAPEVIGRQFYQPDLNKDLKDYILQQDRMVFESARETDIPQEIISTAKDGVKIMHTIKTPVFDADGRPDYLISVSEDITLKSKMERQLKESREKYSLLVEKSGEGVVIAEGKKIIFANAKFASLLGLENAESAAALDIFDLTSDDCKMFLEDIYDAAIAEGKSKSSDIMMKRADGELIELEVNAAGAKYMGKKIALIFFKDVTAQNKMLKDLRSERERFKNGFEFYPVPLALMTPGGYISLFNAAARKTFNLRPEDKSIYRTYYLRSQLPLDVRRRMNKGLEAECSLIFDPSKVDSKIFKNAPKEHFDMRLGFIPVTKKDNKDGSMSGEYLVIMNSRGPAPQAESAFGKEEILLFRDPAVKCSNDGKLTSANAAFAELDLPGFASKRGTPLSGLFVYTDRYALSRDLDELFRQGNIYNRFYSLNGKERAYPVLVNAALCADGKGFIMTFKNAVARRQLLEELRERQEMQNALLSGAGGAVFFCRIEGGVAGRIIFANGAAQTLLGHTSQDMLEMRIEDFLTPEKGSPKPAQALVDAAVKELDKKASSVFSAKIYAAGGVELEAEITAGSFELGGSRTAVFVIRGLNDLIKTARSGTRDSVELNGVKSFLSGVLFKTDIEGVILDGYTNSRETGGFYNIARYKYKAPYAYLDKDAADTFVYSVKEALSVNIPVTFSFSVTAEDGVRHYEGRVFPLTQEQQALVLLGELTGKNAVERKMQALYEISSRTGGNFTGKVDEILELGKKVFSADAGFVMRFSNRKDKSFSIVYASENEINIKKGMVFPGDRCLDALKEGETVVNAEISGSACHASSFCKDKKIQTIIAGPLYMGGKVEGGLVFVSRGVLEPEDGDAEFAGVMARLLGLGIELRAAGKLLDESKDRLEDTFKYLTMPAAVIAPGGEIEFLNGKFLEVFGKKDTGYKSKNLFESFTEGPHAAKKSFFASCAAEGKNFLWEQAFTDGAGALRVCSWQVNIIRSAKNDITGFALIGELK